MKNLLKRLSSENYLLSLGNLIVTNIDSMKSVETLNSLLEIEDTKEIDDKLVVRINNDNVSLYLFFSKPYENIKKRVESWSKEISFLSKIVVPFNLVRVYARNMVHDFRGSINSIYSMFKFVKDDVKDLKEDIEEAIKESRESIESNLSMIGLGKPKEITIKELEDIVNKELAKYFDVNFTVNSKGEKCIISPNVFKASLSIILQQIFSGHAGKEATVNINIDETLQLAFTFSGNLDFALNDLIFLENNSPLHSLGFLRMTSDRIFVMNGKQSTIRVEWGQ